MFCEFRHQLNIGIEKLGMEFGEKDLSGMLYDITIYKYLQFSM